jgi:hypothetical protein
MVKIIFRDEEVVNNNDFDKTIFYKKIKPHWYESQGGFIFNELLTN